jgi:hypothetical protein
MKNDIEKYIESLNKYNEWEEQYKLSLSLTPQEKFQQYIELMDLAYLLVPKERIEMLYQEKLKRLTDERKLFLDIQKQIANQLSH